MNKVYVTIGLPASGKSSWAKQKVADSNNQIKRVNKDDLRAMLDHSIWSKHNEHFVLTIRDEIIVNALKEKRDVIVDDTNLAPKHLEHIRQLVKPFKADVLPVSFLDVSLEECIRRDKTRPNYVGEDVIKKMHRQFCSKERISSVTSIEKIDGVPDIIICDIDGTVALMNGRSPYDEAKADTDLLNTPVADIVKFYMTKPNTKIIFMSGRDRGRGEKATIEWLSANGFVYEQLYMRAANDKRKDTIVKKELYDTYIKGKYNVSFVLDDRSSVIEMWRSLGLTCLQVAPGDF